MMRCCAWLLAIILGLSGCSSTVGWLYDYKPRPAVWSGYWGWPVPIVRPGDPFLYVERQYVGETTGGAELVRRTKLFRFDASSCRRTDSKTFGGAAEIEAWAAEPGEIWIRLKEEPSHLRTFAGETMQAPPRPRPSGEILEPFTVSWTANLVHVWDLARRRIVDVPKAFDPGETIVIPSGGKGRFVLEMWPASLAQKNRIVVNELGDPPWTMRTTGRIEIEGRASDVRLLDAGGRIAVRAQVGAAEVVSTFALPGGKHLSTFNLPSVPGSPPTLWSPSGRWFAEAANDDHRPFMSCAHTIRVVDITGATVRDKTFAACVQPARWTQDEGHVVVEHYQAPAPTWWSLEVASGNAVEIPNAVNASTPRSVQIGGTAFYVEGPENRAFLMAVGLSTGRVWQVTEALGHIGILAADPVARKLYVSTDMENLSVYDLVTQRLARCKL